MDKCCVVDPVRIGSALLLKASEIHGKLWKIHGEKSMDPLKTIEHGTRAKFDGKISMLSMLSWNRKIVRNFHMKAQGIKPRKP